VEGRIVALLAWLRPRSVNLPSQTAAQYTPIVVLKEAATLADLQDLLNVDAGIRAEDTDNYYVVESVEYQVAVLQSMLGGNPPILSYSALVHISRVEIL
jgi:hypothetical protein